MTKTIHVPRIAPRTNPRVKALLPENYQQALSKFQLPDHVIAARQECAYQFLEEEFLPQIEFKGDFDYEWLLQKAKAFKVQFQSRHPSDFRDFSLISSIEAKLEVLQMSNAVQGKTYDLVRKGYTLLRELIDKHEDDLRQI